MRAGEVLDAQGDLTERLTGGRFQDLIDRLGEFEFGRSGGYQTKQNTPLSQMASNALRAAETYRVTHDMSLVVEHAAMQLDDLDRFDSSLAPSGCGFVAFDRPLPITDQRGKTMLIHYLVWGPVRAQIHVDAASDAFDALSNMTPEQAGTGTLMLAFNDRWRQPDQVDSELHSQFLRETEGDEAKSAQLLQRYNETMGRWATVGASGYLNGQRLGPALTMPGEAEQAKLLAEGSTPTKGHNSIRYLHALWLLMGQTMVKVETEEIDRPARRRAQKRKLPPKVTVIKLRREQGAARSGGESLVEWAHRWVVKAHWRWQVCSEHHVLAQEIEPGKWRARIWINPYIKGPDGAPFVQSSKVYSLER